MKISNENHHHAKYLWCERCSIDILNIIYFLQIVTNDNTSFILEKKIVRVRFINEYSFQWYQLIIVSFIDDFSRLFRLNSVVFHLRSFYKFLSIRMSQHSSSMKRRLRQIVDVKFRRRSSMLCEIREFSSFSRWFKSCSQDLSKIFELAFLERC
jgi:hypothetical protein